MYVSGKFKTKKSLVTAVKAGEKVMAYSNSPFEGGPEPGDVVYIKMPPDYHKWYAQCKIGEDGYIATVK